MKIVHVAYDHGTDDTRIYHKECLTLAEAGHDVYYVTSDKYYSNVNTEDSSLTTIVVPLRNIPKIRYFAYLSDVKKVLLKLDADVYHIHEYLLLPLVPFLKKRGYTVIYDMHELAAEQNGRENEKKYGKKIAELIRKGKYTYEAKHLKQVDFTIVVTPYQVDYVKQHTDRIAVLANFPKIDLDEEYTPPQFLEKSICFTGGVKQIYHHEEILKALEMCPDVTYELAGNAADSYLSKLENYPAWYRVNYHGLVSRENAIKIQQKSRVGMAIHSSSQVPESGSFGSLKNFEYLSSGIPIICTKYTIWLDITKKWNCGICVDPSDVDEIAEAINQLTSDPELCAEMGANGRRAIEQVYNWDSQGSILLKVYEMIEQKNIKSVILNDISM